ncbi:MAG: RnfH family protein [Rubrivivax sp.]|nr:RnfH family protein [Rubrivivax sp.]
MASAEPLRVEVVYCPRPGHTDLVSLTLAPGATLADALQASGLLERHGLATAGLRAGIWCRASEPDTPLRDRDRVEIYRPLQVDPKEARRQRYQQHKERSAAKGRPPAP